MLSDDQVRALLARVRTPVYKACLALMYALLMKAAADAIPKFGIPVLTPGALLERIRK